MASSTFTQGIYAKQLTNRIGWGVTLNPDGSKSAVTGPELIVYTDDPEGVVSALPGSLVLATGPGTAAWWGKLSGSGNTGWSKIPTSAGGGGYADDVELYFGSANETWIVYQSATKRLTATTKPITAVTGTEDVYNTLVSTGTVTVNGAVSGQDSGTVVITTGSTIANNAGATAGNTGVVAISSGSSSAVAGTAGASGAVYLVSGNGTATGDLYIVSGAASAGNSGNIVLTTGSASGLRGVLDINAPTIDTSSQATVLNIAAASATSYRISQGATAYVTFDTSAAKVGYTQRLTVTDGVTGGTARVVGGLAFSTTADSATVTGNGAAQSFNQSYSIPANTLGSGSTALITGCVRRTGINGGDTATVLVRVGGTAYLTSVAVAAAAGDRCSFSLSITSRAAPGGAVTVVGAGQIGWSTLLPVINVAVSAPGGNSTSLATNGALTVDVQINMPNNVGNTAVLEQLTVTIT